MTLGAALETAGTPEPSPRVVPDTPATDAETVEPNPDGAPRLSGDHSDDDGQYVSDLLTQSPQGITDYERFVRDVAVTVAVALDRAKTRGATTYTMQRAFPVTDADGNPGAPVQLLPPDPRRVGDIVVWANGDVRFGSDTSELYGAPVVPLSETNSPVTLMTSHTGPLYALGVAGGNTQVVVNLVTVTK